VKEQNEFACTFDSNGTMLRITKVPTLSKAEYTVASWVVPNIEEAVRNLMRRGIRFERYLSLEQDDLGVWAFPSGALVAWFKDPDGSVSHLPSLEINIVMRSLNHNT
jgi:hypothetical protein